MFNILIVVLDTNIWYHETQTIGQDISITVGGEYDWDTRRKPRI